MQFDGVTFSGGFSIQDTIADWDIVSINRVYALNTKTKVLYAWGNSSYGSLGDGTAIARSSPVQIAGNWNKITGNTDSTFGLKSDYTLWGWGYDDKGIVNGNSSVTYYRSSPVQIGTSSWTAIAGSTFILAIKPDGTLWAWGWNASGQLGIPNDTANRSSPVQISALPTI